MAFFVDAKVMGIPEVSNLLTEIQLDLKQGLQKRLKQAAKIVATAAKSRSKSRRVRSAISFDLKVVSATDFEARIGPLRRKAFFAHFLELGTKHSRAFPFLKPALEATEGRVVDLVGKIPSLGF